MPTPSKSFITPSLRSQVFAFLRKKPGANIYDLYYEFKEANKESLKAYKRDFLYFYRREQINYEKLKIVDNAINKRMAPVQKLSDAEKDAIAYLHQLVKEVVLKK